MEEKTNELKTVFETGNMGVLAIAESLLNSADIEYFTEGEIFQSMLGVGLPRGFFSKKGTLAKIKVKPEDEQTAKELLEELSQDN